MTNGLHLGKPTKVRQSNGVEVVARKLMPAPYQLICKDLYLRHTNDDGSVIDIEVQESLSLSGDILAFILSGDDLWFYESPSREPYLDFSPSALGYKILP